MMKRNIFVLCVSIALIILCSTAASANGQKQCIYVQSGKASISSLVYVPKTDVLMWYVENTGGRHLHYQIHSLVDTVAEGTVEPGKTISGSKLGIDLLDHNCYIMIHGETYGKAELYIK
jgi:hypothetical protein